MKLVIAGRMAWKYEEVEEMRAEMQFKGRCEMGRLYEC